MSTQPQPKSATSRRGRVVQKRQSLPTFYIILGVILVIGIGAIAFLILRPSSNTAATETTSSETLDAPALDSFPSKGSADAPVTVIEYADYQCPACAYFATSMESQFDQTYVSTGKVRFIYHEFPLPQHQNAIAAASAARAAGDQGKYWEMHDLLYAQQVVWSDLADPTSQFVTYAQSLGLDTAKFEETLKAGTYRQTLLAAQQAAGEANISQTPTFVVNGKQYTMDNFEQGVQEAVAAAQ